MGSEAASMAELIVALEKATLMAKQLPNTREASHIRQIYATFHSTHHRLTTFLANQPTFYPQPSFLLPPQNESMQVGDDDDDDHNEPQHNSNHNTLVDGVDQRNSDFFIQNKRPKRPLSPSAAAKQDQDEAEFDPLGTNLRSLDLVYQFHV